MNTLTESTPATPARQSVGGTHPGRDRARNPSLSDVLEHLGTTVLDLLAGDPDVARTVDDVVIFDRTDHVPIPHGSIVLGVPVTDLESYELLINAIGTRPTSAIVVRSAVADREPLLVQRAHESGVVLLGLATGATWHQLSTLLESALRTRAPEPTGSIAFHHDLFGLANAICSLIDAPVTIEDRNGNMLAFSDRQEEADFVRIDCVLGRRTTEAYIREDEARGAMRAIRRSHTPVFLEAIELDDDRPTMPRVAVAIRAGDEFLGTIWAVVRGPIPPEHEHLMLEASRSVAVHLLQQRQGADDEHNRTSDQVGILLSGGPDAPVALNTLGLSRTPCLVLAMSTVSPPLADLSQAHTSTLASRMHERQRTAASLRVHLSASTPGSVVAIVHDQIYAIVPARRPQDTELNLETTCRTFLGRTKVSEPMLVGIGRIAHGVSELPLSRADADRAIRVLRHADDGRDITRAAVVDIEALLLEVQDLAISTGRGPAGAYARLLAYDKARNASMVATSRAWLDSHGDIVLASEQSHVHQNTFRYRLKRISEIGEFDLDDPDARFHLALQLRLFGSV